MRPAASAVVVCVAPEYAASANCQLEAQLAKKRRKPIFYANVGDASPTLAWPRGYDPDAIKRFIDTDELWTTTIELATQ